MLVHDVDGSVLETRTVAGHGPDPTPEPSVPHPREPQATEREAPSGEARPAHRWVGGDTSAPVRRAGRAAAREADRARRGAGARVEPIEPATPAALPVVIPRATEEPGTAAERAGRLVHRLTEQVATPLDELTEQVLTGTVQVARLLNPLRATGQAVGVVVTAGVSVASLAAGRRRGTPGRPRRRHTPTLR